MEEQDLIKIVPDDSLNALFHPASSAIGTAFGDILNGIFNLTLGPVRKFNIAKDKELNDFAEKINIKTNEIPVENRDESKMGVALKALEDSKYQLNQEQMREYFANLISNTLDDRKNFDITPRYSEILANMTIREANTLKTFFESPAHLSPTASIFSKEKDPNVYATSALEKNIVILKNDLTMHNQLEISLMEAANLIQINKGSYLSAPYFKELYDQFENSYFMHTKNQNYYHLDLEKYEYSFEKGHIEVTPFGKSFCEFVMYS